MKTIVRASAITSSTSRFAASPSTEPRCPEAGSINGGFHIAIERLVPGEPSREITCDVVEARQSRGQLARVGDRRRGQQEARRGAVQLADPPQPPQHVGHVRAEDPAVDVRLVDDDDREVAEEVAPRRVVGEDADVQHVRVGQHDVGLPAQVGALLARRVAVVDRRPASAPARRRAAPRLVLRERLRGIEEQRPRARVAREQLERRQLEAERLARRGARRRDRRPLPGGLERLGLMAPEEVDPAPRRARCARRGAATPAARPAAGSARAPSPGARAARPRARGPGARPRARARERWPRIRSYDATAADKGRTPILRRSLPPCSFASSPWRPPPSRSPSPSRPPPPPRPTSATRPRTPTRAATPSTVARSTRTRPPRLRGSPDARRQRPRQGPGQRGLPLARAAHVRSDRSGRPRRPDRSGRAAPSTSSEPRAGLIRPRCPHRCAASSTTRTPSTPDRT